MAKNKLIIEYDYDFDLYGIISTTRDYKLAWLINHKLDLHLVKAEDIKISFLNDEELVISNYLYKTEYAQLRLLKNRSEEGSAEKMNYLLPELNKFDYFIMKKGNIYGDDESEWLNQMQQFKEIQFITRLDIKKLKSRENLIF